MENLKAKLEMLKKNETQVSKELLETKYAKAYNKLKQEIKDLCIDWLIAICESSLIFDDEEMAKNDELYVKYQEKRSEVFSMFIQDGTISKCIDRIMNSYNIWDDSMLIEFEPVIYMNEITAYAPYWVSHCHLAKDGYYYNTITGLRYEPKKNMWTDVNGREKGDLPPTLALILKKEYKLIPERNDIYLSGNNKVA